MRARGTAAGLAGLATLTLLAVNPAPSTAQQDLDVVIAQIQSRAGQHPTPTLGNAVEIHNLAAIDLALAGWSLRVYEADNDLTASITFAAGDAIPAGGSILIEGPNFNATPQDPDIANDPNLRLEFNLASGETDAIPDSFAMALIDPNNAQVDTVATIAGVEDMALNPDQIQSGGTARSLSQATDPYNAALRRDCIYTDTDNNTDDFQIRSACWGCECCC